MYFPTDRTHFPGKKLFQIIPIRFPSKGGPGGNIIPYPNWGTTSPCNRMAHDGTTKPMFFFLPWDVSSWWNPHHKSG